MSRSPRFSLRTWESSAPRFARSDGRSDASALAESPNNDAGGGGGGEAVIVEGEVGDRDEGCGDATPGISDGNVQAAGCPVMEAEGAFGEVFASGDDASGSVETPAERRSKSLSRRLDGVSVTDGARCGALVGLLSFIPKVAENLRAKNPSKSMLIGEPTGMLDDSSVALVSWSSGASCGDRSAAGVGCGWYEADRVCCGFEACRASPAIATGSLRGVPATAPMDRDRSRLKMFSPPGP